MTRKCFFVQRIDPQERVILLDEGTSHHIENVLRLKAGTSIELRDGFGNGWHGVLLGTRGRGVEVELAAAQPLRTESPLHLTLVLAFSRSDRMELVLRQATQLGVNRFLAFRAERSQYGLSGGQAARRIERWSKIVREALCQSGRSVMPEVSVVAGVDECLESLGIEGMGISVACLRLLAWEDEPEGGLLKLWRARPACKDVIAAVGPEGGWTSGEIERFRQADYHTVRLGPRVLRLETAALALLASVQMMWGDLGVSIEKDESHEMP